ncbi:MAG: putative peptidoglycan glycosyltransferase FtsW [Pseudomonadota bacterium]
MADADVQTLPTAEPAQVRANTPLTVWWDTIDRPLLAAILLLTGIGAVVSLAASPSVAINKGLDAFHFVERHLVFAIAAMAILLLVSGLSARQVRRLAALVFAIATAGLVAVLIEGEDLNGAQRWLRFATFTVQPSEFLKPAFVVLCAWAFSQVDQRRDMPAFPVAASLLVISVTLLALQPDVGQALLLGVAWGGLMLLSGLSGLWLVGLIAIGSAGLAAAYLNLDYVRARVDAFVADGAASTDQTARAIRSFTEGGFLGKGPGAGQIKSDLPDAHTDFIFAVIAEEYGVVACLFLVALFGFITIRLVRAALQTDVTPDRLALVGLALVFAGQALINMGVNVGLLPPKGMTLPLISSGGSSMLAIGLTLGMALALQRAAQAASAETSHTDE